MKRLEKIIIKNSSRLIIALVMLMIICFIACHIYVRKLMIQDYDAVVGHAYAENADSAKILAEYLYSNDLTQEEALAGQQVMKEFGYTSDGMYFAKTYDKDAYLVSYIVIFIIFILLIALVVMQKKKLAIAAEEERLRVRENMLHSNLGEKQFLEKKNRQTQSYIENVAHQVRTPLTNVMLNIGMIYDEQSEENKAVLDECNYHVDRINRLMERLLKIGRLEAGRVELAKQQENIKELFERLISTYSDEKRIVAELCDINLNVDYDWLYEAFKCLLDNSLEHIEAQNHVYINMKAEDSKAIITIEDDGYGFNDADIPYLFERFYSTGDAHAAKHYGIGLNLAKLIIENHYGIIRAYNRAEGGAGFLIELPRYKLK